MFSIFNKLFLIDRHTFAHNTQHEMEIFPSIDNTINYVTLKHEHSHLNTIQLRRQRRFKYIKYTYTIINIYTHLYRIDIYIYTIYILNEFWNLSTFAFCVFFLYAVSGFFGWKKLLFMN